MKGFVFKMGENRSSHSYKVFHVKWEVIDRYNITLIKMLMSDKRLYDLYVLPYIRAGSDGSELCRNWFIAMFTIPSNSNIDGYELCMQDKTFNYIRQWPMRYPNTLFENFVMHDLVEFHRLQE